MNLQPVFQKLFPENYKGGECAVFAERLAKIAPVGDSLQQKMQAVLNKGIPAAVLNLNFRPGDVFVTSESKVHGHVAVVNNIAGNNLQLTESNFHLDGRVNHTRLLDCASPKIVGVIRGAPLYPVPPTTFPIQPTVTVIMNNQPPWQSLINKFAELQNWFWQNSNHQIQLVINNPVQANLSGWPTLFYGDNPRTEQITESWFDQHILPLAPKSDIVIFVVRKKDWNGKVFDQPGQKEIGYCYEPHYPIKITMVYDENDDYAPFFPDLKGWAKYAAHEIVHGLYGLCATSFLPYGTDLTHKHFYGMDFNNTFHDLDLNTLALKIQ